MYLVFVPLIDLRKMPCLTQDQLLLLAVETSLWNIRYYSRLNGPKIRVPFEKKLSEQLISSSSPMVGFCH